MKSSTLCQMHDMRWRVGTGWPWWVAWVFRAWRVDATDTGEDLSVGYVEVCVHCALYTWLTPAAAALAQLWRLCISPNTNSPITCLLSIARVSCGMWDSHYAISICGFSFISSELLLSCSSRFRLSCHYVNMMILWIKLDICSFVLYFFSYFNVGS